MVGREAGRRWRRIVQCVFGGVMCLVGVGGFWAGLLWYWALAVFGGGIFLILGRRRIFKPGVTRTPDGVVCRYVPWYEGNAYLLNVLLPLFGIASIVASWAPGNPTWLRFSGAILLILTPLFTSSAVRMWRRSSLLISPSMVTVRVAASNDDATVIPRQRVKSITPKTVPNGVGGEWAQVEIAYHSADSSDSATKNVLLGLQLSVQPINLLNALAAWYDGAHDDPSELLDRIDGLLRGRSLADV